MKKKGKTAEEFMNELKDNVQYQEALRKKEEERIAFEKYLEADEFELLTELNSIGLNIYSVWDLVNTNVSYPEAIPILIKHLQKDYHERTKEGIVRALTVKDAKGKANCALISEYNMTPVEFESYRWAIGNAINMLITKEDIDSILKIVMNKDNGISRQMFVMALGKIKSEKTENVLISLLDDNEVIAHALDALGKLKSKNAKEKITYLKNHPRVLVRKEAEKVLKKIENS